MDGLEKTRARESLPLHRSDFKLMATVHSPRRGGGEEQKPTANTKATMYTFPVSGWGSYTFSSCNYFPF